MSKEREAEEGRVSSIKIALVDNVRLLKLKNKRV